jgi:Na+/melibiose symporter-like transporter
LLALFVDAISDPVIGTLSDRINSKFGRRHLLMGLSLVPISITYFMLFIPDKSWSEGSLFLWLFSFTILTRFSVTLFDIPHRALAAEIPNTYEEKANIMSMREGFQSIIALSHSFIILPFINIDVDENWISVGLVGSIMMFIFGLVSVLGTRSLIPDLYTWPEHLKKKNTYKEIVEFCL